MTHPMNEHSAMQYKRKVQAALEAAKKVLDTTRNPVYPTDCAHDYSDKYLLAEIATKTAAASIAAAFEASLPRWQEHLPKMQGWLSENKAVTLKNEGTIRCDFVKTAERTVESATAVTVKTTRKSKSKEQTTTVSTTIVEHFWKISTTWEISAYGGADSSDKVVLATGTGEVEKITRGDRVNKPNPPADEMSALQSVETDISWLIATVATKGEEGAGPQFTINRGAESCKTPRRNTEIEAAVKALEGIRHFGTRVASTNFFSRLFQVVNNAGIDLQPFRNSHSSIFSPVLTMFSLEEPTESSTDDDEPAAAAAAAATATATAGIALSGGDLASFLAEHKRSMGENVASLADQCPSGANGTVITPLAAGITSIFFHISMLCQDYTSAVGAVEAMLKAQLIAAIGKEVQPKDFAEYMDFHNRKIFKAEHAPERFCYAIRREGRYPDGTLSIEQAGGDNMPLLTSVVKQKAVRPMKVALSAASELSFMGDRYVHAAIMHSFSGQNAGSLNLVARAKQFSSFVLLAGKITAADQFEPTAAVIVKDKDDLSIPLLLETIPTPKEFRDAIESLSPEQQRFAKAYRSLQLSSTLFGVCIIQIKPQLEQVLNLPDGALTKEIQLTQDLMDLFIKYQVPSDLLSYDGPADESQAGKLVAVKDHVGQIKEVIQAQRDAELQAAAEEKAKALLEKQERERMQEMAYDDEDDCEMTFGQPTFGAAPAMYGGGGGGGGGMRMKSMARSMPMMAEACAAAPPPAPMAMGRMASNNGSAPRMQLATKAARKPAQATGGVQQQPQAGGDAGTVAGSAAVDGEMDYTKLPTLLDSKFEELDTDSALRPTIIKMGSTWTRKAQAGLLSKPATKQLREQEQKDEKGKAFDLLDALTRSGVLEVSNASFHVVIAATHCFDKTVTNAVIMDNINPIEKVERSTLIVASAINGQAVADLVQADQKDRVELYSPMLFP